MLYTEQCLSPSPYSESLPINTFLRACVFHTPSFQCSSSRLYPSFKSLSSQIFMAAEQQSNNPSAPGETNRSIDVESIQLPEETDYSQRANWLRAAVLGANDGLVSTASLMMGVGAIKTDTKVMIVSGLAGLVAGACSMAIGEFVSVYSQVDIEVAQMKREKKMKGGDGEVGEGEKVQLPSPTQAAAASALAFSVGAIVPLLTAAFIKDHKLRLGMVAVAVTLALLLFGGVGAKLGKASLGRSCARILIGGWLAMLITFGVMKVFGSAGL